MFEWIGFDADDTLWKNSEYYLAAREEFIKITQKYGLSAGDIDRFDDFEIENIQYYGYGVMSFILSMIEIAIEHTQGEITSLDIQHLVQIGKNMLSKDVEVYDGIEELLNDLSIRYPLILITKGDLFHQQRKIKSSGLKNFFKSVEIVSEKSPAVYSDILDRHAINPDRFLMVGNSLRSDILPVLDLGGITIHFANHLTWSHEAKSPKELPLDRYQEVKRIEDVLEAVKKFEGSGLR
jgi:putative hydrolase of the HAD superfamily